MLIFCTVHGIFNRKLFVHGTHHPCKNRAGCILENNSYIQILFKRRHDTDIIWVKWFMQDIYQEYFQEIYSLIFGALFFRIVACVTLRNFLRICFQRFVIFCYISKDFSLSKHSYMYWNESFIRNPTINFFSNLSLQLPLMFLLVSFQAILKYFPVVIIGVRVRGRGEGRRVLAMLDQDPPPQINFWW